MLFPVVFKLFQSMMHYTASQITVSLKVFGLRLSQKALKVILTMQSHQEQAQVQGIS